MNDYYDDEIDPYAGYALDEYNIYDEEYIESQTERAHYTYIYKAPNGHLAVNQFSLVRYPWLDWGEALTKGDYWMRLGELTNEARANVLMLGKTMPPDTSQEGKWVVCAECGGPLNADGECLDDTCEWEPPF